MVSNAKQVTLEKAMEMAFEHYNKGSLLLADRTLNDILNSVPDHAAAQHLLGIVKYRRGDISEAVRYTALAVKNDKDNALFNCNYAIMLSEAQQYEESIKFFEKSIHLDPEKADTYSNKANTLWLAGRAKEAEENARKSLELKPDNYDAYLNLGNALEAQGKKEEAFESWTKAVELNPDFAKGWNNLGNLTREMGKLKESEEYCRKALEKDDKQPQAWNNLANALRDMGKPSEAEEAYRKALQLKPDFPEAHNNLALALHDQGKGQEALASARYAVAFRPNYADAYINLSIILRELSEAEDAEQAAQKAITLAPDSPLAYMVLADALYLTERYDEIEEALTTAKEKAPDHPLVYLKLASVLGRMSRNEEALKVLDEAEEMIPDHPELHYRKGHLYYMSGMPEQSRASLNRALEISPNMIQALGTLAELYQSENKMDESMTVIRKALDINNDMPFLHYTLGKLKKYTKDDPDFISLAELEKIDETFDKLSRACLNFSLFKAHEDLKDYKKAFAYLKKGNDFKRETVPYQPEENETFINYIRDTFDKKTIDSFDRKDGYTGYKSKPIFIVGMPRSGTTLTEQIISSHPDVHPCGELEFFGRALAPNVESAPSKQIGKEYMEAVYEAHPKAKEYKFFTDKMPGNYQHLSFILQSLPDAKIIHCRRNPIDTCLSCYKQMFARGQYWSYNLEELAGQYNVYMELIDHYRKTMPDHFIEVDYEETVNDLETQARRMIDYIGLEWHDACLEPHKQKRTVMTASKTQVTKPVYKTSVKAWQRYEKELQPLIKNLNLKDYEKALKEFPTTGVKPKPGKSSAPKKKTAAKKTSSASAGKKKSGQKKETSGKKAASGKKK